MSPWFPSEANAARPIIDNEVAWLIDPGPFASPCRQLESCGALPALLPHYPQRFDPIAPLCRRPILRLIRLGVGAKRSSFC